MNFNKNGFDSFRRDLEEVLKQVSEKHQVEINTGKIKYSEFEFTMNLKVTKQDEQIDGKQGIFEKECQWFGFKPEHYKARFTLQGKEFELIGFNPRSPKNCCSIHCIADGKTYKCGDESVKRALKLA